MFYVRDGAASVSVSKEYLDTVIDTYIIDRQSLDREKVSSGIEIKDKLIRYLCRGKQNIDDSENIFILMADKIPSHENSWIGNINWTLGLDFDPLSNVNGILKNLKEHEGDKILTAPYDYTPRQLEKARESTKNDQEFRKFIKHGAAPVWIKCNQDNLTYKQWHKTNKNDINNAIRALTCVEALEDLNKLIIITLVCDNTSTEKIASMVQEFMSLKVELFRFVFVFEDKKVSDQFYQKIKNVCDYGEFTNQSIYGEFNNVWQILNTFVKDHIKYR